MYLRALNQGLLKVFSLPRLSIPIILTLSLTLGAVLTVVAMINNLMLKPLPDIKDEGSLFRLSYMLRVSEKVKFSAFNQEEAGALASYYKKLGEISSFAAMQEEVEILGQSLPIQLFNASTNMPTNVLKQAIILGELPSHDNYKDKVWISEQLWLVAYDRAPNIIGQVIKVGGKERLIQGVLPNFYSYKKQAEYNNQQVWQFYSLQELAKGVKAAGFAGIDTLIYRVKERALTEQDLQHFLTQYFETHPEKMNILTAFPSLVPKYTFEPYRQFVTAGESVILWSLLATVSVLLMMACLNLLNLYLAHYQQRRAEWATHISIGGKLKTIRRLIFLENFPAILFASFFGLLAAAWLIRYLPLISAGNISLLELVELDMLTFMYALVASFIINLIFTYVATLPFSAQKLLDSLSSSNKGITDKSATNISKFLFIAQISFAVLILTCCAMLAQISYEKLNKDMGYNAGNTLMAKIELNDQLLEDELTEKNKIDTFQKFRDYRQRHETLKQVIENYSSEIRVLDASIDPFGMSFQTLRIITLQDNSSLTYATPTISPDYAPAFDIEILEGRNLTQQEYEQNMPVALVNKVLADVIKRDQNLDSVVGHYFSDKEIIGVLDNTHNFLSLEDDIMPQLYSTEHSFNSQFLFLMQADEGHEFDRETIQNLLLNAIDSVKSIKLKTIIEQEESAKLDKQVQYYFILMLSALTLLLAVLGSIGMARTFAEMKRFEVAVRMSTGALRTKLLGYILASFRNLGIATILLAVVLTASFYLIVQAQFSVLPPFSWSATSIFLSLLLGLVLISIVLVIWKMINQDPMRVLREE